MANAKRHFVAHVLTGERGAAVDALRHEIAGRFGVKAALRLPPHMTLFYPFECADVSALSEKLADIAARHKPFSVPVAGFAAFGERVWFLDPAQDAELFSLKDKVRGAVKAAIGIGENDEGRKTHFHVTLAYKDVEPETHRAIGAFLKGRPLPIKDLCVDNLALLVWDEEREIWDSEKIFAFGA